MSQPFYLTTPIYYVNAKPHLGHAYSTIMADTLTRYHRMRGETTWFVTGTDEHGDKIVQAAEAAGQTPQAFSDGVSDQFRALWKQLGIINDDFIRTTEPRHKAVVQAFLQRVYDAGDIYFGEYGGHYCYGCERFYTEKELENGLCPQHLSKPEYISEKNYFFKMSKYQDRLKQHILDNPDFIRPERYKNEVLALLDSGALEDLCISRPKSRLTWGIELPFDSDYVCYVWFDALLSYVAALGGPDGEKFKEFWPGAQHLVAKDILKPHAVFWPTMLMSAGVPLYRHLNVHGYWLVRDTKMSKSLGNVVDPATAPQTWGMDVFRYFLLREMNFGSDASFTEESLITRANADLANDLGNLFSRVLSMAAKFNGSAVPAPGALNADDAALKQLAEDAVRNFVQLFEAMRPSAALASLWELVRALNKYVDSQTPWALAKANDTDRLNTVMYCLMECMYKVACCVWPVMPESAAAMLRQLGQEAEKDLTPRADIAAVADEWGHMRPGTALAAASNLFPRMDMPASEENAKPEKPAKPEKSVKQDKQAKQAAPKAEAAAGVIEFADFQKLDMRVGAVLTAEQHPNADKLLKLSIDLGEDQPRQIISGLAEHFAPAELVGAQVCVVVNLAPRTIRGLESQGMVLTAESGNDLRLLTAAGAVAPGAKIS